MTAIGGRPRAARELQDEGTRGARPIAPEARRSWTPRDALLVFGLALGLRLAMSALLAGTYDPDEFVYLALGHDVAQGAVPYRDFAFFHPAGVLDIVALLNPLIHVWWPVARLVDVLLDSVTAALLWWIGSRVFDRRAAIAAGILYAVNPIVLVSAVRVDQEAPMTLLCILGVALMVGRRSTGSAVLAGVCLAGATWIKYPMIAFLPAYILCGRRRAVPCLVGFTLTGIVLLFPYLPEIGQLVHETVIWQVALRDQVPLMTRLETVLIFWLLINPFAVAALLRRRTSPVWIVLGFAVGGLFLFTSSVYSHYLVPAAPFVALLGAPVAAELRIPRWVVLAASLSGVLAWAAGINAFAGRHGFIIGARFAKARPVVQLIDRLTPPGAAVLGDRFEYAYLSNRHWVAHYFWDQHTFVTARSLERQLAPGDLVVLNPRDNLLGFPTGLPAFLNAHYPRLRVDDTYIWRITTR